MVTATIFSNSAMVIIDIGDNGEPPWLQETTYLLNKAGKTTATIAQTDQPTSQTGTGPFTVPVVTGPATVTPASDASVTDTPPSTSSTVSVTRESFLLQGQASPSSSTASAGATITTPPGTTITTPPSPLPSSLDSTSSSLTGTMTNASGVPPPTPSIIGATSASAKPLLLSVGMGVAAAVLAALLIGMAYYLYRRRRKGKAQKKGEEIGSEDSWISPSSSPTNIHKEGNTFAARAMRAEMAAQERKEKGEKQEGWSQRWPQEKSIAHYALDLDEGSSDGGRYDEIASLQEERLYQLRTQNHSPPPHPNDWKPSQTLAVPEGSSLPPLPRQTTGEVNAIASGAGKPSSPRSQRSPDVQVSHNEFISTPPPPSPNDSTIPQAITKLASILKQPPTEPKTLLAKAQSLFNSASEYKPTFAEAKPQVQKKGVTFGEDQVREFGLTPVGSCVWSSDDTYEEVDLRETEARDTRPQGGKRRESGLGHDVEGEVWKNEARSNSRRR